MAAEAEAAVLGQRRAAVETTLRETQEENDEFRRRILGLEQQLKEARGLAEGGEVAEARLRDKVQRLEVSASGDRLGCLPALSPLVPAEYSAITLILSLGCFRSLPSSLFSLPLFPGVCFGVTVPVFALEAWTGTAEARTEAFLSLISQPLHVLCLDFFFYSI